MRAAARLMVVERPETKLILKNEIPAPSELRQWFDDLGAQLDAPEADREVVFKTCQLIAMSVSDPKKPLPDDVFAAGMNEQVCRLLIAAGCAMAVRIAATPPQLQQPRSRIIVPKK